MAQRPNRTRLLGLVLAGAIGALSQSLRAQSPGPATLAAPAELAPDRPSFGGVVTFAGLPVPGATITASRGDAHAVTSSDGDGTYVFAGLAPGVWTVAAEMLGFAPAQQEVTVPADGPAPPFALILLPFEEIARTIPARTPEPIAPPASNDATSIDGTRPGVRVPANAPAVPLDRGTRASGVPASDFQRAALAVTAPPPPAVDTPADDDSPFGASDGFLINGSVNNGAASPFAQARAFGNARPGQRSLWNGAFAFLGNTSAWDARPYSFAARETPRPDYRDLQFNGTFGGPIKLPGVRNRPIVFLTAQRAREHATTVRSALVPSLAERAGDFSASRDPFGRAVRPVDPETGQPFPDGAIPAARISPQAAALLAYYPLPTVSGGGRFNYDVPIVTDTRQASMQARVTQSLSSRNQLVVSTAYTRTDVDTPNVFGFVDAGRIAALDATVSVSHRLTSFHFLRARYQVTRSSSASTPFFSGRRNVSGLAGITGNNQDPENWGPPTLTFTSGLAGLSTGQFADNTSRTHGGAGELSWTRGRHAWTFGAGLRRHVADVFSQQNARGTFGFTGGASGSDLADFLLGLPATSAIAFGNADKALRGVSAEAYANDDWRVSPSLTLNAGVRWEYESPMTEAQGRLVNLDLTPDFSVARAVVARTPTGPLTGDDLPAALVRADWRRVQPRIGLAWRPLPGSSLVVRAGYGLYRNTSIYQPIALLLAQQPPLSAASSVSTSAARPLTLADGFVTAPADTGAILNTFAVDPNFRASLAENWQVSAQRDLPASLTVTATYLGSRGHNLMQQSLPNTYPAGAVNPCPACPSGFIYLTSRGSSRRHAGQLQVRRRLRNGLTATVQYTLAKATDDAAAYTSAALAGAATAQDWRDLDAERGRSAFDQRHQVTAQVQYTTGAGIAGGTLVDGVRGRLLKDWTVVAQLVTGSGLPLTPVVLVPVAGTGVSGTIRAALTGAPVNAAPTGFYLNPEAYARPAAGSWGDAGRNSISGPAQFSLNAGLGRTFRWGPRLNLDWRMDATNVLNRVTFSTVNALVGSPQFGLADGANQMRRLQSSVRLRF